MFVAIDPGLSTGWSIWNLRGLVACGLGDPRSSEAHRVTSDGHDDVIHDVWIESPVIYPRSKARPADITKLARESGRWAGVYEVLAVTAHFVEPAEWKGQVPKAVHHARLWAELTPLEQSIVHAACRGMAPSKRHNVLDAVGLGLWAKRRGGR